MTTSVLRSFALVAVTGLALNGCYFGRSPTAKRAAYVGNGVAALTGVALLAGAAPGDACSAPGDGIECVGGRLMLGAAMLTLGSALLAGALVGTLVTTAIPTVDDGDDVPRVLPFKEPPNGGRAIVTAPGLQPAQITVR